MSEYYFAYGSNMDAERMAGRGLVVQRALSGQLPRMRLVFNKQAYDAPHRSYANVSFCSNGVVEGVLYQLGQANEITKMDPFEGTPRLYSRELFAINTVEGDIHAWVYVANKALLNDNLKPERWYLNHLLAGERFLSADYFAQLAKVDCLEGGEPRC